MCSKSYFDEYIEYIKYYEDKGISCQNYDYCDNDTNYINDKKYVSYIKDDDEKNYVDHVSGDDENDDFINSTVNDDSIINDYDDYNNIIDHEHYINH